MHPSVTRTFSRLLYFVLAALACTLAHAQGSSMIVNPVIKQRADPHVLKHTDGDYYFTASVPEYDRIILRRSTTLAGLSTAEERVIWRRHEKGEMAVHIWAPEIHFIDGKWYIYFTAGRSDDIWAIRLYVLENSSADPTTGTWIERGQLKTEFESFSLDATTFVHRGQRYLVWTQRPAEPKGAGTDIYIARMRGPLQVEPPYVSISSPTLDWEVRGHKVNEAPAVLIRNDRVFITFSASATDANYCMGLLTADADANLLDRKSWTKSPAPVFTSNEATSQYGPGHNSFTVAEDGKTDVFVYHARQYKEIVGDPLYDPNRNTRIQPVLWDEKAMPKFGVPVADGPVELR
jgi:GH43 family beta-xylosidase